MIEDLEQYARPIPKSFAKDYALPDGICSPRYCADDEKRTIGFVVQLLTQKAFDLFPEAPTEGPTKGLLWFDERNLENLCAFEQKHGLHFHAIV